MNDDGRIDLIDAALLSRYVRRIPPGPWRADWDIVQDGVLDSRDVAAFYAWLLARPGHDVIPVLP